MRSEPDTRTGILASEPCLTCYAEDCNHRRKIGKEPMPKDEFAALFPAPYICDTGGYSICEGHWPYAMVAGWNPRRKDEVYA